MKKPWRPLPSGGSSLDVLGPRRSMCSSRSCSTSLFAESCEASFIMQRKQLLGIMRRAESTPAETLVPWEEPCLPSHHTL